MNLLKKIAIQGIIFIWPLLCSGCYFNSAGHLFRNAAYDAQVDTTHMGKYVYYDGTNYYAEFMRFRVGKKVVTQYDALNKKKKYEIECVPKGLELCRISKNFASYLINGKGESSSGEIKIMEGNQERLKEGCSILPVKATPEPSRISYRYKSPNAIWYYLAGSLDWLCVDLPVTCIENSLAIVLYPTLAIMNGLGNGVNEVNKMNEQAIQMQQAAQMAQLLQMQSGGGATNQMSDSANGGNMNMPMGGQMPFMNPYDTLTQDPETGKWSSPSLDRYRKTMDIFIDYERRKLEHSTPKYY